MNSVLFMPHFLETGKREKYEKKIQTSVDNAVNNLHHEFKFQRITFCINDCFVYASLTQCLLCTNDYLFP